MRPADFPADLLDRFEPIRLLGQGGMGRVYLARERALGRMVALKFLLPGADDEHRQRFLREGRTLAGIRHPQVMEIYSADECAGGPYLVTEYLEGRPLHEVKRRYPLVATFLKLAEGLDAIHAAGVLHRDIKPPNILFTESDRPVFIDFGLAKAAGSHTLTKTGALLGTMGFLPPEVLVGRPFSPASDWYAWGVSLYCLAEGAMPYSTEQVLAQAQGRRVGPRPFSRVRADSPVARLLVAALDVDPARRPVGAAAVRGVLDGRAIRPAPQPPDQEVTRAGPPASEPAAETLKIDLSADRRLSAGMARPPAANRSEPPRTGRETIAVSAPAGEPARPIYGSGAHLALSAGSGSGPWWKRTRGRRRFVKLYLPAVLAWTVAAGVLAWFFRGAGFRAPAPPAPSPASRRDRPAAADTPASPRPRPTRRRDPGSRRARAGRGTGASRPPVTARRSAPAAREAPLWAAEWDPDRPDPWTTARTRATRDLAATLPALTEAVAELHSLYAAPREPEERTGLRRLHEAYRRGVLKLAGIPESLPPDELRGRLDAALDATPRLLRFPREIPTRSGPETAGSTRFEPPRRAAREVELWRRVTRLLRERTRLLDRVREGPDFQAMVAARTAARRAELRRWGTEARRFVPPVTAEVVAVAEAMARLPAAARADAERLASTGPGERRRRPAPLPEWTQAELFARPAALLGFAMTRYPMLALATATAGPFPVTATRSRRLDPLEKLGRLALLLCVAPGDLKISRSRLLYYRDWDEDTWGGPGSGGTSAPGGPPGDEPAAKRTYRPFLTEAGLGYLAGLLRGTEPLLRRPEVGAPLVAEWLVARHAEHAALGSNPIRAGVVREVGALREALRDLLRPESRAVSVALIRLLRDLPGPDPDGEDGSASKDFLEVALPGTPPPPRKEVPADGREPGPGPGLTTEDCRPSPASPIWVRRTTRRICELSGVTPR